MSSFKKILVGIDFSPASMAALDVGVALARRDNASLTVVHSVLEGELERAAHDVPNFRAEEQPSYILHRYLEELVNTRPVQGLHVRCMISLGRPTERMLALSEELKPDLVVVAPTGKGRLQRALVGSTAQRLIESSHVPLLIARPRPDKRLFNIAVAVDYTEESIHALQLAAAQACRQVAGLHILHVVDHPGRIDVYGERADRRGLKIESEAERELRQWVNDHTPPPEDEPPIVGTRVLVAEDVVTELSHFAHAADLDLLVIGHHERGAIRQIFERSTAHELLDKVDCHLMIAR